MKIAKFFSQKQIKAASSPGFTIMEIMVATAVFSIVLIAAQSSYIEIGKLFYKGVSVTQTQNTATQILAELKTSIQTAPPGSVSTLASSSGYSYYCISGNRYTFNLGHKVDTSASQTLSAGGNYGILEDSLPGAAACAPPCDPSGNCPNGAVAFNNPKELLGNKMRVDGLSINQSSAANPNLYQISLVVVYGDDSVLSNPTDPSTAKCSGGLNTQSFCYVSRLNSYVFQGITG